MENIKCPSCGSNEFVKNGHNDEYKKYLCKKCRRSFNENTAVKEFEHVKKIPNVLVLDVEITPMEVYVWGLYKQRISHKSVIADWSLLSWAGKLLFHNEVYSDCLTPKEAVRRDDKRICESLFKLVNEADVIIAHNGIKYDIRAINARFILNGIAKPKPYQIIDTLMASRRMFKFSSHTLDYIGKLTLNKQKLETEYELWLRCLKGDQESLDYMMKYNIEDVLLLEEVYNEIRAWIPSHPNLSLYAETDKECCPVCLSTEYEQNGHYTTQAGEFDSYTCSSCGSMFRKRNSNLKMIQRKKTFIPNAR
jgi:transposase-like protein